MKPNRRSSRAFTAVEVLLATVVLVAVSSGVQPFAQVFGSPRPSTERQAEDWANVLHRVAARHHGPGRECPTAEALVRAGALTFPALDPWGKEYWFACRDGGVTVVSDGPDGKPFTSDDLHTAPRRDRARGSS